MLKWGSSFTFYRIMQCLNLFFCGAHFARENWTLVASSLLFALLFFGLEAVKHRLEPAR